MQSIDIFTATASFLAGGLFIHFFGVKRTRVSTLEKALQESCLKYALALENGRRELEAFKGERMVFKGIINSDTQRAERLMDEIERQRKLNNSKLCVLVYLEQQLGRLLLETPDSHGYAVYFEEMITNIQTAKSEGGS